MPMIQVRDNFDYKAIRFIIKERIYNQIDYMVLPKDLLNNLITEELIKQAIGSSDELWQKIVLYRFRKKPMDVHLELGMNEATMIKSENGAEDKIFRFIFSKISRELCQKI